MTAGSKKKSEIFSKYFWGGASKIGIIYRPGLAVKQLYLMFSYLSCKENRLLAIKTVILSNLKIIYRGVSHKKIIWGPDELLQRLPLKS